MRVLIADKFESEGVESLRAMGCEVIVNPEAKDAALARVVDETGCQVLIVRSTRVDKQAIQAGRQLGLIIRAGAGYDNIDVAAASSASIYVSNCPGKNATAVAELTFGLILALDRRIPDNVLDLRNGKWAKKEYSKARGLKGRTLGIIGVGRIGELVALRARAFEMNVVGWSRSLTSEKATRLGMLCVDLPEEVAVGSDIISVHLAAVPETTRLVGKNIFDEMKPGSYFINTSRSEVVDHAALATAVKEKGIRVGLDVFGKEPGTDDTVFQDEIVKLNGVIYGTHHIGASTDEAQMAVADETVQIVKEYMTTGHVRHCVNLSVGKSPKGVLVVRHRNRPGVLAHVLGELSHAGINVREMENVIYEGEEGACAQIRLDSEPSAQVLQKIERSDENILGLSLTAAK